MSKPRIEFTNLDNVDPHLVEAALSGRLYATDLTYTERVYVAGKLTTTGDTAAQIATRLRTSLRTAQRLQAAARKAGLQ